MPCPLLEFPSLMPSADFARRRALLTAALGFALVDTQGKPAPKEIQLVREWLDNWKGLGQVVTGLQRQGFRLHLTNVEGETWRANVLGEPGYRRAGLRHGTDAVARGANGGMGCVGSEARARRRRRTSIRHECPRAGSGDHRPRVERGGNRAAGGVGDPMAQIVHIFAAALLGVSLSAGSASAECAWVLWNLPRYRRPVPTGNCNPLTRRWRIA
jgi:hypothetical protein